MRLIDRFVRRSRLVAVLSLVASALVGAAFGAFVATAVVNHTATSGVVDVEMGADNTAANRLTVTLDALAPGDTHERAVTVRNVGTLDWSSTTLDITAATTSVLDQDTSIGLQVAVDACSQAWSESGLSPDFTYTCAGTQSSVIAATPVALSAADLGTVGQLTAGSDTHLRFSFWLPVTTTNLTQGKSSTLRVQFTATQRGAAPR